ncbi:MAG: spore germination protein [Lachnospiraceae bacterium]|nr:spore germination protein [Lachnospiraceae bacterium]
MSLICKESYEKTIDNFDQSLAVDINFDILKKEFVVGDSKGVFYYINGMCDVEVVEKIQEYILKCNYILPDTAEEFDKLYLPYLETDISSDENKILTNILSGVICFYVEKYSFAFLIDTRRYPSRNVSEPEKYRVLRGSRDGFVETLTENTALIRRRIRSTDYRCEIIQVGDISKTDVAICYMDNIADKKLLSSIRQRIKDIKTDALTLSQESLSECLHQGSFLNPFPKFRYSERPDTAASEIIEGYIVILVDTSPAAMILPTTIFDVIEEADDYYFPPVTGTYLRLSRLVITLLSLILTPLYLLFANNPSLIPSDLMFLKIDNEPFVPIILQLLSLELCVDGLKLAAVNTPSMLNTPLSIIAAIVIGEFAIETGWFISQTMLYMAVVAIANFTHENYEFAYAIKYCRIIILILTQFFALYGFVIGLLITVLLVAFNKTLSNTSYIYPLYPFDKHKILTRFIRLKK